MMKGDANVERNKCGEMRMWRDANVKKRERGVMREWGRWDARLETMAIAEKKFSRLLVEVGQSQTLVTQLSSKLRYKLFRSYSVY